MFMQAYVACNFKWGIETEGLLKVTVGHVHCRSGNSSKMVRDRDIVAADH